MPKVKNQSKPGPQGQTKNMADNKLQEPAFSPQEKEFRFKHRVFPLTIMVSAGLSLAVLLGVYTGFASFTVWLSQQRLPSILAWQDIGCGYHYNGSCYDGINKSDAEANGLAFYPGPCSAIYSCQFSYVAAQTSGEQPPDNPPWWDPFCGNLDDPYYVPPDGWPDSPRNDDEPHSGIDIFCPNGTPLCLPPSAGEPTVFGDPNSTEGCGLGIIFPITLPDGRECQATMCHLSSTQDPSHPLCGDSGNARRPDEGPQVHIHIVCDDERIDPLPFLPPPTPWPGPGHPFPPLSPTPGY
jgi:hypothetical protein